jgi:hypothetical protein
MGVSCLSFDGFIVFHMVSKKRDFVLRIRQVFFF